MEWHLNIPKILHVYWGGNKLPYIRYMTVRSFINHNPDWDVMFWYSEHPTPVDTSLYSAPDINSYSNYLPELMKLNIKKNVVDVEEYGFNNDMSEIHKSDFIRYQILSTIGGVWADMDIIFIKPITQLVVNSIMNKDKETFISISGYGHSIGFLMGCSENNFFKTITSLSKGSYNKKVSQCIGSLMLNHYYPTLESVNRISPAVNIDMEAVYPYNVNNVEDILGNNLRITESSVGVHWYGGHPMWKNFIKNTDGGSMNLPNSIISNIIKQESSYEGI